MIEKVSSTKVRIDRIVVLSRRRQPTEQRIEGLRKSLHENGLLSPISIRIPEHMVEGKVIDGQPVLVFGATRLAAAKAEGWEEIPVDVVTGTEFDFLKAEIAENLHRGELTALERDEQLAAYEKLLRDEASAAEPPTGDRKEETKDLSAASGRKKVGHRPKGSVDATSRRTAAKELGVNEKALRRAATVAALSPAAKEAAQATGVDKNQSALLTVAKQSTPETQVAEVLRLAESRREAPEPVQQTAVTQSTDVNYTVPSGEDLAAVIVAAWRRADHKARQRFLRELREEIQDVDRSIDWLEIPAFLDRRKPRAPVLGAAGDAQSQTAFVDEAQQSGPAVAEPDAAPSAA